MCVQKQTSTCCVTDNFQFKCTASTAIRDCRCCIELLLTLLLRVLFGEQLLKAGKRCQWHRWQSALETIPQENKHTIKSSQSPETSVTQQAVSNSDGHLFSTFVVTMQTSLEHTTQYWEGSCLLVLNQCTRVYVYQCCTGFSCLSTPSCKPLPMETPVAMFLLYLVLRHCSNSW